mmetsp:Transcript_5114/g.15983  ORF Transcript_5114/g.15983 Transcript_5114/m.15983 type:complete len:195 (+) Transcript_5114:484-1068(+)
MLRSAHMPHSQPFSYHHGCLHERVCAGDACLSDSGSRPTRAADRLAGKALLRATTGVFILQAPLLADRLFPEAAGLPLSKPTSPFDGTFDLCSCTRSFRLRSKRQSAKAGLAPLRLARRGCGQAGARACSVAPQRKTAASDALTSIALRQPHAPAPPAPAALCTDPGCLDGLLGRHSPRCAAAVFDTASSVRLG